MLVCLYLVIPLRGLPPPFWYDFKRTTTGFGQASLMECDIIKDSHSSWSTTK
jgi:hypothetical protein